MTAILVPVLGRPHRVVPLLASIKAATPEPHSVLFVANEDDEAELAALKGAKADVLTVPPARRSYACKINDGYRATTAPFIFTAADDLVFHDGWLSAALLKAKETRAGVVGTCDLLYPPSKVGEGATHSLVRRAYADEFGTWDEPGRVMHEGYGHGYVDRELCETARARGAYAHAFDSIVEHLHHKNDRRPFDSTDAIAKRALPQSKRLYRQRCRMWRPQLEAADAR